MTRTPAGPLAAISIEALTRVLTDHRRNDVIEPDHSPGGSLARTRVKCDGRDCDFYGVYDTWFLACKAHEEHLAEVVHEIIVRERANALRQAAQHYGVIWGSGVTTEENVAIVLSHWADHGVGTRQRTVDEIHAPQPEPQPAPAPKRFDTHTHADGRECLFMTGWSWKAFSGDEQSAVRVTCPRDHTPWEGPVT